MILYIPILMQLKTISVQTIFLIKFMQNMFGVHKSLITGNHWGTIIGEILNWYLQLFYIGPINSSELTDWILFKSGLPKLLTQNIVEVHKIIMYVLSSYFVVCSKVSLLLWTTATP